MNDSPQSWSKQDIADLIGLPVRYCGREWTVTGSAERGGITITSSDGKTVKIERPAFRTGEARFLDGRPTGGAMLWNDTGNNLDEINLTLRRITLTSDLQP